MNEIKNTNNMDSCVYMLYNELHELLYVGITNNHDRRLSQHVSDKDWKDEIKSIKVSEYVNRNTAHIYEIYYISRMKPKYNGDFNNLDNRNFNLKLKDLTFSDYCYDKKAYISANKKINTEAIKGMSSGTCKMLLFIISNKDVDKYLRINDFYPTIKEVQDSIDLSREKCQKALRELKELGYINVIRKGRYNMIEILV